MKHMIALIAIFVLAGGCSTTPTEIVPPDVVQPLAAAPAGDVLGSVQDAAIKDAVAEFASPSAPSINIYGELDGVPRTVSTASQDVAAAFAQHTQPADGNDGEVSLDPSGRTLVFSSTRHSSQPKIYLQKIDGASVVQLTSGQSADAFPVFSPDGKQIAFCSTRNGSWDIYTMDGDGRGIVQVTSGPSQDMHPTFSPDGARLCYSSLSPRGDQWELWVVTLATGQKRMIGQGLFPSWSPDRTADCIAFQRPRQRGSRWFGLWTLNLVDGEACRLTEVAVSTNSAIVTPAWSPDGSHLAFATIAEPATTRPASASVRHDIWVVRADGTHRRRLTDGQGVNLMPFWAVDNRVYFISDRAGREAVWSVQSSARLPMTARTSSAEKTAVGSAND